MERVDIFDTTLRDGEQSPGASMSVEQKLEVATQLGRLGVDIIEAGFPISSPHQFEGCRLIAGQVKGLTIAALARTLEKDIDAAAESIGKAEHPRIHTFIATSPIHMEHKLRKNPDEVLEMAVSAVRYARKKVAEVEFSPEDATRSEVPFLCRIIEKVIDAGARVINIPDTVGYSVPDEFSAFLKRIMEGTPNIGKAVISVHCHNDLGLAVANSVSAVQAGARQVEVTINGIGERAGNASLEEFVMAMYVRRDRLPFTTGVNTKQIWNTSRLLASTIGFPIPRNKPITGENAFAHESGIHQDGVLKKRETYEIMTPESVGRDSSQLVLGRHSGLHGFRNRLSELGFALSDAEVKKAYDRFLVIADRKKEVYDDDLYVIVADELGHETETYGLDYFNIQSGNLSVPTATVRIVSGAERFEEAATGDGPVDAIFNAIDRALGVSTKLLEYIVHAVTPGKQAIGEVSTSVEIDGRKFVGRGASTDILEASARAYVNSLNRWRAFQAARKGDVNGGDAV
ncbi:MAG TPA: 2-isopropylmalate synthase [Spirochaetia bacterium]|nr:2-isopropylmalate synthase [Spirochaetia bacterium]